MSDIRPTAKTPKASHSPEQFPLYEKLFSKAAESKNNIGMQTIQKLFFSIKVTAYFDFLRRYDRFAGSICDEVLKYSGYKEDDKNAPMPVNHDATLSDMLQIANTLLHDDELQYVGYFIVDMLLIRPFAVYAEQTGRFRYPACQMPEATPDEAWDFDDEIWDSTEVPF